MVSTSTPEQTITVPIANDLEKAMRHDRFLHCWHGSWWIGETLQTICHVTRGINGGHEGTYGIHGVLTLINGILGYFGGPTFYANLRCAAASTVY